MAKSIRKFFSSELFILLALITAAFLLRFWRLSHPAGIVFDETYYANFAQNYLTGKSFFDVHPPLGKLLIALGVKIFGFSSFGWRVMPALFGSLLVPIVYVVSKKIFKDKLIAFVAAFFLVFDGLFLVQSRTALIDIFVVFFVFVSFWFFLNALEKRSTIYLVLTGISFGLALATKWTALPFLFIFLIYLANSWKKRGKWIFLALVFLIILPCLIYLAFFLFDNYHSYQSFFSYLAWWHAQTLGFHLHLKETHPYQSRWYSWLFVARPVWYYYQSVNDKIVGIIALGNPLIWWPAIGAFGFGIWELIKKKKIELFMPIAAFLLFYLSWAFVSRTQFQYYILPAIPFYFMILAYFWKKLYNYNKSLAIIWLVLVVVVFVFFYPILTAWPIAEPYYRTHLWFRSWI